MKRIAIVALLVGALLASVTGAAANPPPPPHISGTVTPTSIAPEVRVCVVEPRPSERCTSPGPTGEYELTGVPFGQSQIEFIPSYRSGYAVQYFDHVSSADEATAISLIPTAPSKEEVDADLELGAAIEGTVTSAMGAPLAEVEVCVLEEGRRVSLGCTDTDQAGDYQLGGLSAGSYQVGFYGHGKSAEYAPQYYDGAATLAQAVAIPLAAGEIRTGVDAAMTTGARIEGRVSSAIDGASLENIAVCLFAASAPSPARCTYSGVGGGYSLLGIPAGNYQVGFSLASGELTGEAASFAEDGYLTQWYENAPTRASAVTLVPSGSQVIGGIDASLATAAPPAPPAPPAAVSNPLTATAPSVPVPTPAGPKRCKRGFVRKKVKGTHRCVKVHKKHRHHHRKHKRKGKR